jgi:MFS family permease
MAQLIGIIIALTIAILIGQDASKRGMNAWGWGIGVFLLLIIFLPLYFILRKPKLETKEPIQDNS